MYVGKDLYNNDNYIGSGKLLRLAIKKYGICNFKKDILECCIDIEEMNNQEIFWIKNLNTFSPNGYNINVGGKGGDTYTHRSEEEKLLFKKNLKQKHTGKKRSKEVVLNMSLSRSGKPQKRRENVECPHCHRIGDKLNFSRWHFDYCKLNPNRIIKEIIKTECPFCHMVLNKANASQWHFDYCKLNPNRKKRKRCPASEETKIKIGNSSKNRHHSEFSKNKTRKSMLGIKKSEETKEKNRIATEKRWKEQKNVYICKYCGFESRHLGDMNRWHNDNCNRIKNLTNKV